jgi:Flp pilus assembly protein TadG
MRRLVPARASAESGSALVEFSLIVSLLMVFLFGIITFGALMAFKSSMTQAAEEGARAAIGVPYTTADVSGVVTAAIGKANSSLWNGHQCSSAGMTCHATVDLCRAVNGATTGHYCVTVTLTYDYAKNPIVPSFPLLNNALPKQLTETAVVQLNDPTT